MKFSLPQITVITVTYNLLKNGRRDAFLQCLESVHNQTYPNIEHLIIDGASTDGTVEMLQEYAEKGWIKYVSEPDSGVCDAMNKGIKQAKGEYIAILNSDDYYYKDALWELTKALLKRKADYSFASTHLINKDGSTWGHWTTTELSLPLFFINTPFNHEAMLCKKSVYEKLDNNGYFYHFKEYGTAADYEFLCRLILADFKYVRLEKEVLNFRMDGNTSPSSPDKMSDIQKKHISYIFEVYLSVWKRFLKENDFKALANMYKNRCVYFNMDELNCLYSYSFITRLISYLSSLRLLNYDYEVMFRYFEPYFQKNKKIKKNVFSIFLFNSIPFLTIKENEKGKKIYLLGMIPLVKIKIESENRKN